MKYLLLIFFAICFMSCHDLHQKLYDTFHGKKESISKDSTAKKDSILKATMDSSLRK